MSGAYDEAQTGWVYRTDETAPKPTDIPIAEPADLSGIVSATVPTRPVDPADGIPPGPPVMPPPVPEPVIEVPRVEPARFAPHQASQMVAPVAQRPQTPPPQPPLRPVPVQVRPMPVPGPVRPVAVQTFHTAPVQAPPVRRLDPSPRLDPGPAPASGGQASPKGWIESGFYVMTLPIAITAGIMFAPVAWIFGKSRR